VINLRCDSDDLTCEREKAAPVAVGQISRISTAPGRLFQAAEIA
jgi:hypothetical protein